MASHKCGNRNAPLHKAGAARLLAALLVEAGELTDEERRKLLEPLGQVADSPADEYPTVGVQAGREPKPVSATESLTGVASVEDPF